MNKMWTLKILLILVALGSGVAWHAPLASAHHSFAEFDRDKPITLHGVVTKMDWSNPHSWLYIDVTGPDGKVVNWGLECGAPNALVRRGYNKDSVSPGTEIVAKVYAAKSGANRAYPTSLTLVDGRKLFLVTPPADAPKE